MLDSSSWWIWTILFTLYRYVEVLVAYVLYFDRKLNAHLQLFRFSGRDVLQLSSTDDDRPNWA